MILTPSQALGMSFENSLVDIAGNTISVSGGSPSYVNGKFGRGLDFDKTNSDSLSGPNTLANIGTGSLSAFFWVNYSSIDGSASFIFCNRLIGAGSGQNGWFVRLLNNPPSYPSGTIQLTIDFSSVGNTNLFSNTAIFSDEWHHIGFVIDRSDNQMRIYIDTVEDASVDISAYSGDDIVNTEPFLIGEENRNQSYYDGIIDEVHIYHKALSESDIKRLYHGLHPLNG